MVLALMVLVMGLVALTYFFDSWIIMLCGLGLVAIYLAKNPPPKINGIYSQQRGLWFYLKYVVVAPAISILTLARKYQRRKLATEAVAVPAVKERGYVESQEFIASDKNGNILLAKLRRRHQGSSDTPLPAEIYLSIRLADGRFLTHPLHPDSLVVDESPADDEQDVDEPVMAAGGLRIICVQKNRIYRLIYSGLLKDGDKVVEVNFRFWFRELCDPADYAIDFHPAMAARALAAEPWSVDFFKRLAGKKYFHSEQAGDVRGFLEIRPLSGLQVERQELQLRGCVGHVEGSLDTSTPFTAYLTHAFYFQNATVMSLTALSKKNELTHGVGGFSARPSGWVSPISKSSIHMSKIGDSGNIPNEYCFSYVAAGEKHHLSIRILNSVKVGESDTGRYLWQNFAEVRVDSKSSGFGVVQFQRDSFHFEFQRPPTAPRLPRLESKSSAEFCSNLASANARLTLATGGKASKLADMFAIKQDSFSIPDGFAICVAAYEHQLKKRPALSEAVSSIVTAAKRINREGTEASIKQLEEACSKAQQLFESTSIVEEVESAIMQALKDTFGNNFETEHTAVRSSAVGEDAAEASGAGQMDTFLGVRGSASILQHVRKCWASHFAFRAVQYRRQLGSTLDTPMSVVVQRLVHADVAGVLFTRHPDSGSMARMTINASYGIGESVVSGAVEPDTICILRKDYYGKDLGVIYEKVGEKGSEMAVDETESGLLVTRVRHGSQGCCLTEDEILKLARAGLLIESIFGSGRDIEFAIKRNKVTKALSLYILQARPITTADMENEWELLHEFDSPLATDAELITTANVQEMMPGALCPLGAELYLNMINPGIEEDAVRVHIRPKRRILCHRVIAMAYSHVFFNYSILGAAIDRDDGKFGLDLAFFGQNVDQITIQDLHDLNDMQPEGRKLYYLLIRALDLYRGYTAYSLMTKLEPTVDSYGAMPTTRDPKQLHEDITKLFPIVSNFWKGHMNACVPSVMNIVILMQIMNSSGKWASKDFVELSKLLSTCQDVFSADVPTQMQGIAQSIKQSGKDKVFIELSRSDAAKWLANRAEAGPETTELFERFIEKHGHRCVRDTEVRETSWKQEPEKVVDAIQAMLRANAKLGTVHDAKKVQTVAEAVDSVDMPLTWFQKRMIRWILPKARESVGRREWAKSLAVKITDKVRQRYHRLAKILAEDGYLPDADLTFFLTHGEIGRIIQKGPSAKLIAKAQRRRKLLPKLMAMEFPEFARGYPEPIQPDEQPMAMSGSVISLPGVPVGQGSVQGIARVVTSLAEANAIQNGDILVVSYTDVGWTPYFPLITGLVTELGGLISHGAVVAREYGLPCLVGCKGATKLIKTGSRVKIDGLSGTITVVQE